MSNRLKKLREAQGLSLVALAAKVGTSSQQISHLELGKRHLTVEWLERLADVLGCHPWAIVSEMPADLSELETRLLEAFGALSEPDRKALLGEALARAADVRPTKARQRLKVGFSAE
ncbi:MAG: helix-turn-helix domain-containing protein [Caulobacteraceae bacterium]